MKSSCRALLAWLTICIFCTPTWSQEHAAGHSGAARFPWERMNSTGTDLVFLLDRSGSVGHAGFETELTFVDNFLNYFEVMPNATRVAIVSFSDKVVVHADFLKEPDNKCKLSMLKQDAIKNSDYYGTNTGAGLREVREIFRNSRQHAHKVLVLVTDGMPTVGPDPVVEANELKNANVEIFVFAIGKSIINRVLLGLASSERHLFECDDVVDFRRRFDLDGARDRWQASESPQNCDHLCNSPYRGQQDDPGCCRRNAVCGCDLSTGASGCLCGPGFYGDGLHGECTPCKPNTYKETYYEESCQRCPDHSEIKTEGSRSLKDCTCKIGYVGGPASGKPCVPVTCPPLQAPEHGRLEGPCDTSYGSECLLACDPEYELTSGEDDFDSRTCQGDGTWSGKTTVCQEKQCGMPPLPDKGHYKACNGPWKLNDTCSFQCDTGYTLKGSSSRNCTEWGWSGDDFTCEAVQCPPPAPIRNAVPAGDVRGRKPYTYLEYFQVTCLEGFEREGPAVLICGDMGRWIAGAQNPNDARCVDNQKPRITCPRDIKVAADPGKNSTSVSWPEPTYSDNDKSKRPLLTPPHHSGARRFSIGTHKITYTVTDGVGLNDTCTLVITVLDQERPQVRTCPDDIDLNTTENEVKVTWEEPVFADNSGNLTIKKPKRKSGSVFEMGTHRITYTAEDGSGNRATCVFHVNVWRSKCPFLAAPLNGALACDEQYYAMFCQPLCNDRFEFLSEPADTYFCDSSLQWKTMPPNMAVPWPDCAAKSSPVQAKKMYRAHYYYKGDCREASVQKRIRKAFTRNFEIVKKNVSFCASEKACNITTVAVTCGNLTEPHAYEAADGRGGHRCTRLARSAVREAVGNTSIAAVDAEFVLEVGKSNADAFGNETQGLSAAVDTILDAIGEIDPSVLNEVSSEEHLTMEMRLKDYYARDFAIVCADGEALNGDGDCVKCPKGSFHDRTAAFCSPCPMGTYQDQDGAVSCKPCPEGAVTFASKSTSVDDCQVPCAPGTFSRNGLGTCRACPPGTYQDKHQQVQCKTCPEGSSSEAYGSDRITDCKKYCEPGTYSESGLEPCAPCKRGFYQEMSGRKSCVECPVPKTNLHEGSQSSYDCVEINHCASNPCLNGTCVTRQHDFICKQD
ncbi:sushi, von Willebrand factor type A, EGF and pentraxin domain-containing protein 1-like [Dermacentor andersoni]|uniref:sushi, von Willebrand factor type A, EGF and pentraxin domain-containing protein 1-like n=1 Tax=Dermacentor andersoni TaxID=34620 RepID=UPI002155D211|nr:sushi, von Willebrand factor type A, EGF and pentraxin domain-containing protein 1-like [Dermacentor andersoni]